MSLKGLVDRIRSLWKSTLEMVVLMIEQCERPTHHISPVGWGCKIHRLLPCRGVRLPNECPGYDTKQSDSEVSVILELWGMQNTPSLPSLPGPLWPGVVASDRVPSIGQIELNRVLILNWIVWNKTVYLYKNGFGIK